MTRELIYEDQDVRRYEVRDDDGNIIGYDLEPVNQPPPPCPTCGGTGIAP